MKKNSSPYYAPTHRGCHFIFTYYTDFIPASKAFRLISTKAGLTVFEMIAFQSIWVKPNDPMSAPKRTTLALLGLPRLAAIFVASSARTGKVFSSVSMTCSGYSQSPDRTGRDGIRTVLTTIFPSFLRNFAYRAASISSRIREYLLCLRR